LQKKKGSAKATVAAAAKMLRVIYGFSGKNENTKHHTTVMAKLLHRYEDQSLGALTVVRPDKRTKDGSENMVSNE
jgi:hypothetical protein